MSDERRKEGIPGESADTDRILTLPNVLSFFRLMLIPAIVYCYYREMHGWAVAFLILSGATDVVDGWVARTFHQVSDFGKALDPIADKLTQGTMLLCLLPIKLWWVVGIMACKEISIGVLTCLTLKRTGKVFSAGWYGKLCTVVIYFSVFLLILWRPVPRWLQLTDALLISALVLLSFGKYFAYFTGILREAKLQDEENRA
ncbi:MAG: CDP-alcohol phosphatidyltransferase family protein [Oscillospiraceae bacterium]|nr:CDP-alcohol phosphatidyltransferase family protein [Oscillospiraceae bacterium]